MPIHEGLSPVTHSSGDWTIVTVTYNSASQLETSWGSSSFGDARWVVVDNASEDTSVEVARNLGAEVIRLPCNLGFGAANNVALETVSSRWVAFVNPDVTIADPADFARLASVAVLNDGLIAPQLHNPDGSEQPNARGLPFLADKIANRSRRFPGSRIGEYVRTGLTQPTYCAWAMGAALAGPVEIFRELGGWDEQFFIYYEDHDIGLRAWEAGHPVVIDPGVQWVHEWQRATTRPSLSHWRHEVESARRFYVKYPALLTRRRFTTKSHGFTRALDLLWSPAEQPTNR